MFVLLLVQWSSAEKELQLSAYLLQQQISNYELNWMASWRGQRIIFYVYPFNKNAIGRQSHSSLQLSGKKNKHNRIFWDFLSKLMTPLFCFIWVMCILSPNVLSKILASAVISIFLTAERSLSTFRGSQCHILGIAVAWNWADLPVIPALLLVGWADLEYITSLLKALTPCIQNGDPDSYFIFKEL